jgi:transposase
LEITLKQSGRTLTLADVFARFQDHKINRIDKLLPWNWKPKSNQTALAA